MNARDQWYKKETLSRNMHCSFRRQDFSSKGAFEILSIHKSSLLYLTNGWSSFFCCRSYGRLWIRTWRRSVGKLSVGNLIFFRWFSGNKKLPCFVWIYELRESVWLHSIAFHSLHISILSCPIAWFSLKLNILRPNSFIRLEQPSPMRLNYRVVRPHTSTSMIRSMPLKNAPFPPRTS